MDQLICASLSHTHYRYEGDMLEVPGVFIKLHMTAQSGPAMLFILCHSKRYSQGGSMKLI